jgi:thiol-disulfide isomerase/thioredoxin
VTLNRKILLAVPALLAGLAFLYVILDQAVHAPPAALPRLEREEPKTLPAITFTDPAGAVHSLAEFRGRTVLLNLWGTWCAPCVRELPALAHLSAEISAKRLVVVAVALPPGDATRARTFLGDHGANNLAAYFDNRSMFLRSFRAYGLPVTILIDPEGREVARAVGAQEWDSKDAVEYLKDMASGG